MKQADLFVRWGLVVFCAVVLTATLARAGNPALQQVTCGSQPYQYAIYAPDSARPLPAILLLHGAGDRAENFLDLWKSFARHKRVVLIAPQLPRVLEFEAVAPAVFRCVVDDARTRVAIDPARIYLFGHSMGGYLGFDGAMFDSEYFAAAALHAGDIADDYRGILGKARRKIPIAIYIGDQDPYFPVKHVRQTRDLLLQQGFPVHYREMSGHNHDFYAVFDEVADDAWKFFGTQRLAERTQAP